MKKKDCIHLLNSYPAVNYDGYGMACNFIVTPLPPTRDAIYYFRYVFPYSLSFRFGLSGSKPFQLVPKFCVHHQKNNLFELSVSEYVNVYRMYSYVFRMKMPILTIRMCNVHRKGDTINKMKGWRKTVHIITRRQENIFLIEIRKRKTKACLMSALVYAKHMFRFTLSSVLICYLSSKRIKRIILLLNVGKISRLYADGDDPFTHIQTHICMRTAKKRLCILSV